MNPLPSREQSARSLAPGRARRMIGLFATLGLVVAGVLPAAMSQEWLPVRVPGYWETKSGGVLDDHDGFAWYRCFVKIPVAWTADGIRLHIGPIDDVDETWVNGRRIGSSGSFNPFKTASEVIRNYPIPADAVEPGGWAMVAVRVFDNGGAGGITGSAPWLEHGPSGQRISLKGRWEVRKGDPGSEVIFPRGADLEGAAARFASVSGAGFGVVMDSSPLPGTLPLVLGGDITSNLVAGVDRFLLRKIEESAGTRERYWHRDLASQKAFDASIRTNRLRLAHILGVRDERVRFQSPTLVATLGRGANRGGSAAFEALAVRWPAVGGIHGEGLLLVPRGSRAVADVVAIPDCEQTPEGIAGLDDSVPQEGQFARRLAESGCRVLIPTLIDRNMGPHKGKAKLTAREFLYRSAFELGRHLVGYELQKVLAGIDWFESERVASPGGTRPIGVYGWGEGGMLALYAAALDARIDAAGVSGYFGDRETLWSQPIDRNVFGLLEQFGDAELAAMTGSRRLVVEAARAPQVTVIGQGGGAPATLTTPAPARVREEAAKAARLVAPLGKGPQVIEPVGGQFGSEAALSVFLKGLGGTLAARGESPRWEGPPPEATARQRRQFEEIDRFTQELLVESPYVRQEFMKKLDTKSLAAYEASVEPYREFFRQEVIGAFAEPMLPANVRTRKAYEEEGWTGYEVTLDVFPDVIAYGVLLVPKGIAAGERRPVVVCQHGLEGRPQDVITGDHWAYHDYAAKLAERGYITFAPQNLYIFTDRFRTLQRKANPLKKTLFSVIVPQHQQIVDWLKTLPQVDPGRIAFYGLSYGGKSAMRIPPLVKDYVLSICSADFNEWVWKNASTRSPYSYVWGGEYEIFEFDLGSTFNYAEMAALIAPRPFMVERGHFDGVAPDETVFHEFGKVKFLYAAKLGIGDRAELETFAGPHTIHGKGTFEFLDRHLRFTPVRPRP